VRFGLKLVHKLAEGNQDNREGLGSAALSHFHEAGRALDLAEAAAIADEDRIGDDRLIEFEPLALADVVHDERKVSHVDSLPPQNVDDTDRDQIAKAIKALATGSGPAPTHRGLHEVSGAPVDERPGRDARELGGKVDWETAGRSAHPNDLL